MSQQEKEKQPVNEAGLTIVGEEKDVARFGVGDLVQVHLELKGQVFLTPPHGMRGVVIRLNHEDEEYFYHMPVIQFEKELRMFNPDHIIVVQRADGSPGEIEMLEAAEAATELEQQKKNEEANNG